MLHFIYHFIVAGYFNFLGVSKIVIQDLLDLSFVQLSSQVYRLLFLLVYQVPIDSFDKHSFYYLFMATTNCVHQWSPSFVISRVCIQEFEIEEITGEVQKPMLSSFMEDGIAQVISFVDVERDFSLSMF